MTTLVDLRTDIKALKPGLVALRRELHQRPELAFEEVVLGHHCDYLPAVLRVGGFPCEESRPWHEVIHENALGSRWYKANNQSHRVRCLHDL